MTTTIEPMIIAPIKIENPMQERDCRPVAESTQETAETILTALKLEVRADLSRSIQKDADGSASLLFVP